jgi:putative ABC transport system permease protein
MASLFTLPLRNLARNRRRHLATGAALAFGFAASLLMNGYANSYLNYLRVFTVYSSQTGHLVLFHHSDTEEGARKTSFDRSEQEKIGAILSSEPSIAMYGSELSSPGLIGNGCKSIPFLARAASPQVLKWTSDHPEVERWAPHLVAGGNTRGIWNYPQELGAIAIGSKMAESLGKIKVHDEFPPSGSATSPVQCDQAPGESPGVSGDANVQLLSGTRDGRIGVIDAEVVDHLSTGFQDADRVAILMTQAHLQKLLDTEQVDRLSVWLKDERQLAKVSELLREKFRADGLSVDSYPWDDDRISPLYAGSSSLLVTLIVFASSVLAVLIILSIFSTVTITVLERSREIGALRALGFKSSLITRIFLAEYGFLVVLSLIAGGTIGTIMVEIINHLHIPFHPPGVAVEMNLFLVPDIGYALLTGAIFIFISHQTVWLAVRSKVKESIPGLLARVAR